MKRRIFMCCLDFRNKCRNGRRQVKRNMRNIISFFFFLCFLVRSMRPNRRAISLYNFSSSANNPVQYWWNQVRRIIIIIIIIEQHNDESSRAGPQNRGIIYNIVYETRWNYCFSHSLTRVAYLLLRVYTTIIIIIICYFIWRGGGSSGPRVRSSGIDCVINII